MREMQTIVTDVCGISPSVCLSRSLTRLYYAKTAKQIKILFEMNTLGGPKNIVLHAGPDPHNKGEEDSIQPSPNYFGILSNKWSK